MKITVIGTGYVGLVTGTCFAEMGNSVTCIDRDPVIVENLKHGIIPIYEPGLEFLVHKNFESGSLKFSTSLSESLDEVHIVFIAVGTPSGEDGEANLTNIFEAAREIGRTMKNRMIIVNKSTVPVGTAKKVSSIISHELSHRGIAHSFTVVSNPEFLKEGSAVSDAMKPDRIIVGTDDPEALEIMKELYRPFTLSHERFISMDTLSAEMTKYAANTMLATKISFMNEIARICEILGADVNEVRRGIGSDPRIGYSFIYPGIGYGGSCFPKDVRALIHASLDAGYEPELIRSVERVNDTQIGFFIEKIYRRFGKDLTGLRFAIWGLSFKPETDDLREAPSIKIINRLIERGALINAYDPVSLEKAKKLSLPRKAVSFMESKYLAATGCDALILATEWKEFRSPDFEEMVKLMKSPVIFDGRNQYDPVFMKANGFEYWQVGTDTERLACTGQLDYLRMAV